jgi:hypothetical protein
MLIWYLHRHKLVQKGHFSVIKKGTFSPLKKLGGAHALLFLRPCIQQSLSDPYTSTTFR